MMGFGLLMLNCECWVLDRISRSDRARKPGRSRHAPSRWDTRESRSSDGLRDSRGSAGVSISTRSKHVTNSAGLPLRWDAVHRPGGPGRPGADQSRAIGPPSCAPSPRSRCGSATGSVPINRYSPTSSSDPRPPTTSAASMRAASIRGCSSTSGSTIRASAGTCATPRRSACRPAAGPRSSRPRACSKSPPAETLRPGSPGWLTAGENWSSMWASGTMSSVKASWRTTSGAYRLPVGPVTAGRLAAHQ